MTRNFPARGAAVVVVDLGSRVDGSDVDGGDPVAAVVAEIRAAGGQAVASRADVSTEDGAAAIVSTVAERFGDIMALATDAQQAVIAVPQTHTT